MEPPETVTKEDVEDAVKTFTSKFLKIMGFADSEIKDMVDLSDDELQKRIMEKRGMELNNGHKQKVIPLSDVERFLSDGWEYVNSLPGDKAIIKIPD